MKGTIVPFQKVTVRRRKKQMSTQKIQCIIQKKTNQPKIIKCIELTFSQLYNSVCVCIMNLLVQGVAH